MKFTIKQEYEALQFMVEQMRYAYDDTDLEHMDKIDAECLAGACIDLQKRAEALEKALDKKYKL